MSLLANSNAIESGGYNIDRSLRFRSSASAYLNRTLTTPTNNTTWSLSLWMKRGTLGATQDILSANISSIWFGTDDKLNFYKNSVGNVATSTAVFRDPSAWYHFVFVSNGTTIVGYSNNSQIISYAGTIPQFNSATTHNLCRNVSNGGEYFDGYLAEVNFIDGQALTPSSFGETSTETGVWVPKKYTGTYGTNGFYLNFSDNTSATTLAYDKSGNGNNWTANNISTTAGVTYDSMTDVPTLTSATAANFCVLNPLVINSSVISNGNLSLTTNARSAGSFGMTSGKWYWECTTTNPLFYLSSGVLKDGFAGSQILGYGDTLSWGWYAATGEKWYNSVNTSFGSAFTSTSDVLGVAFDADTGELSFYKNGSLLGGGAAFTGLTNGPYYPGVSAQATYYSSINFGQRPFSYTPPTGFKALNTFNLPDPTIKKPNQYMDATTYTGTGSALSVVNAGGFQPDLVWVKARSAAYLHELVDSVRGASKYLSSNSTAAEVNDTPYSVSAFNSNGFTQAGNQAVGENGTTYVGWQWKESATAGFDIVTYTGNGSNRTISHNLGVAPKLMIIKGRSTSAENWGVYHESLGATKVIWLNLTDAAATASTPWNDTAPTSSVFSLGTWAAVNQNAATYVAYLFAEIPGFSKFGSYTGNGSSDGPFVYCGFRPKYVMVKRTDLSGWNWNIHDSARDQYNLATQELFANLSSAESTSAVGIDMLSNGFKVRASAAEFNASGATYIYAAFAENPFKYSNAR